ncbi:MAG: histidinol-phosphate transaminase [Pseudomonadota bacterium]
MKRPTPRPGLLEIDPYVPGKSKRADGPVYKLSSNESALGPAPSAAAAAADAIENAHLYPDGSASALREKLGEVHGLEPEQIIVGNGSDDILSLTVRSFSSPGDEILISRHGFSYYPILARSEGCVPVFADEEDLTASVDALLSQVTERTRVLLLANPNNPTGTRLPHAEVERLRAELRSDIMLVLDGAYAEYVSDPNYDPGAGMVRKAAASGSDNVIMTRTFSKIYGLGGVRVGWGYAPPSVIDILNRIRGPFNVSSTGLAAAEAALDDQDFVAENRQHNEREMARVVGVLRQRGAEVRLGEGNFIIMRFDGPEMAKAFLQHCESHGVFIRSLTSASLPDWLRISIGSEEANSAFLDAHWSFKAD